MVIEELSDKVLLDIFRYFLNDSPHLWLIPVHICRRWQHIIFLERGEMRLKFCAAGEEGSGAGYAYVGVLAVDWEGRDWT